MNFLTVKQVAEKLNVAPKTIYAWIAQKKLPALRVNGVVRFDPESLERWLARPENNT